MIRIAEEQINTPAYWDKRAREEFDSVPADEYRLEVLTRRFHRDPKSTRYLDVGPFNSPMPGQLSEDPENEVTIVDHSIEVLDIQSLQWPRLHCELATVYDLPFRDNYFHHVVAGELIEHLDEPFVAIREMVRVLSPGHWLSMSTPYEETIEDNRVNPREHVWGFVRDDFKQLAEFGRVEISVANKVFFVELRKRAVV